MKEYTVYLDTWTYPKGKPQRKTHKYVVKAQSSNGAIETAKRLLNKPCDVSMFWYNWAEGVKH